MPEQTVFTELIELGVRFIAAGSVFLMIVMATTYVGSFFTSLSGKGDPRS